MGGGAGGHGKDEGLVVSAQSRSSDDRRTEGGDGEEGGSRVLTAPELGRVVKVGEERVKLVRAEERVTADL